MKQHSERQILDIGVSYSGSVLVYVERHAVAYPVNLDEFTILPGFPIEWDNGGSRVAVNVAGTRCFTGSYGGKGVGAYTLPGGNPVWHRSDLARVQQIVVDERASAAVVVVENVGAITLDAESGVRRRRYGAATRLWISPFDSFWLIKDGDLKGVDADDMRVRWAVGAKSFAILSCTFSPSTAFVSESAGPLRAIDLDTGKSKWELCRADEHYLELGYREDTKTLHGIRWPYKYGGPASWDLMGANDGEIISTVVFDSGGSIGKFVKCGSSLFCYDGNLIDTATSQPIGMVTGEGVI